MIPFFSYGILLIVTHLHTSFIDNLNELYRPKKNHTAQKNIDWGYQTNSHTNVRQQ